MSSAATSSQVRKISWKGRPAWQLSNGIVEAAVLEGGGHIAGFHFQPGAGPTENVLWEAPWKGVDPQNYQPGTHDALYGPPPVGKFLASFTGHALCLDYFGAPSDEETAKGLTLHGEAPARQWHASADASSLRLHVELPYARLKCERSIILRPGESVLDVEERVINQGPQDQHIHWVEHVTLGSPLLAAGESSVSLPADRAKSWPLGYGGKSLVPDNVEFNWPKLGKIDISYPFARPSTGMVVAALLERHRERVFITALNWRLGLVFGYVFDPKDFPWVAIWEENGARDDAPWHGKTQARGLEFGTTPMPIGKRATMEAGPLFGMPTYLTLSGGAEKSVRYLAFVTQASKEWRHVRDVCIDKRHIIVSGDAGESVRIKMGGADHA